MRYFIYIFICYLTKPFRAFYLSDFEFALCYLFPNSRDRRFVWSEISHETGKFTSLNFKYNNVCGMAWIDGEYQDGWRLTPEGKKATYLSIFKGLYDYYDLIKNRKPLIYEAIQEDQIWYPTGSTVPFPDQDKKYIENVCLVLKGAGFYTSSSVAYSLAVYNHWQHFKSYFSRFIINIILTICVPAFLLIWFSNIGKSRNYKAKIKGYLKLR